MGEVAALSAALSWAVASLMFAELGKTLRPLPLNLVKCAIALGLMLFTRLLTADVLISSIDSPSLMWLAISGIVGLGLGDTLYFGALSRIGARRTLVLWALAPPMTAGLAIFALDEGLSLLMILGILVTLGGVVWVVLERTEIGVQLAGTTRAGIALGTGAAACQAVGNVLTKVGGVGLTSLEVSAVRLIFAVIALIAIGAYGRRLTGTIMLLRSKRTAKLLLIATLIGTYLGLWLNVAGLQLTHTGVASTLASTSPIFVLPLAYFVSKERTTKRAVLGAIVAVGGIALLFVG